MRSRSLRRRESGIALAIVLVVVLLLSLVAATFASRTITDGLVSRNKDRAAEARALARGGIQIAMGVLFQVRVRQALQAMTNEGDPDIATKDAFWAELGDLPSLTRSGATLRIEIRDSGAKLNLNALMPIEEEPSEFEPESDAEEFLTAFLDKVKEDLVDEVGAEPGLYDTREMARNLLDYIDPEDTAIGGRNEDDYYLRQDPPHRAPNRPLLSVGEIAMIEGFDARFVKAMEPYVTVYPFVFARGLNINTAEPWVLATLFLGGTGDKQLASEDQVREILETRQKDGLICNDPDTELPNCTSLTQILGLGDGAVFPQANLPSDGLVYEVVSEAKVGDVTKRVTATIDVTDYETPLLLSWESR
jgi:general secretion pathway protein K